MTISKNGALVQRGNNRDGSLDVNIQDLTTRPFDLYFTQVKGVPTTLASVTAIDDLTVTVTANTANTFEIGDYIAIFSGASGEGRYYFAELTGVSGTTLTVDTPLDFAFDAGDVCLSNTRDLNVTGTPASPQIFTITNGTDATTTPIDINRIMLTIDCATPLWTEFGNIVGGIDNGIVLRRVDGDTKNYWNAKSNAELAVLCYDLSFRTNNGTDGVFARYTFNGQDKHGVAVRLYGGDSLQVIVQDDLTSLDNFRIMAQGQETFGEME